MDVGKGKTVHETNGVEFAPTPLATAVTLHYADGATEKGRSSSSCTGTPISVSPTVGCSPCSRLDSGRRLDYRTPYVNYRTREKG